MAIDLTDITASVAVANVKTFGDGPAFLLQTGLSDYQTIRTFAFNQTNKHALRVDVIAETALTTGVAAIQKLSVTEGVAIRNIDPPSAQIATKGSQSTPPETGK
jgi:hypothetical protein